jgi:hypothetical protein
MQTTTSAMPEQTPVLRIPMMSISRSDVMAITIPK